MIKKTWENNEIKIIEEALYGQKANIKSNGIASINYDSILENNTLAMEKAYNSTKFHEDK